MDIKKTSYWTSTLAICAMMTFSASMYFTKTEMVRGFFDVLNYPTYLVYPLAIAKVLGIVALLSNKSKLLKEWAYAGFFFDTSLAALAHYHAADGGHTLPLVGIALIFISRYTDTYLHEA